GTEDSTLRIRDVESGRDLEEVIPHTRHVTVCWRPDGGSFFYTRYPKPGSVPKGEENYRRRVYAHRVGEDPADDALVFEGRDLTDFPTCVLSPNGRWLVVRVQQGWNRSELFLADTSEEPLRLVQLTG